MTPQLTLDDDFFQNAQHHLKRLRCEGPAHRVLLPTGMTAWLVTDYDEVNTLLADPRLGKSRRQRLRVMIDRGSAPPVAQGNSALSSHMLASDPPDHTRLRTLVNRAFTTRRVAGLRGRVEAVTDELLDRLPVDTEVDLLAEFAPELPLTVISELMGIPRAERAAFRGWVDVLFLSGRARGDYEQAADGFVDDVRRLIARARVEPGDDLVTALVEARDGTDRLSEDELLSSVGVLISAGYETTVNLIGNCVHSLLRHPDQLDAVRRDPQLTAGAVEETLRFECPAYLATLRFTREDVACGDVTIPAHEIVMLSPLAAHQDPARFPDPDDFDVARDPNPHLAFGHGPHFCLGAGLARLEAQIAVQRLLARFDTIVLAADPESLRWKQSTIIHGLERLPVRLNPRDPGA